MKQKDLFSMMIVHDMTRLTHLKIPLSSNAHFSRFFFAQKQRRSRIAIHASTCYCMKCTKKCLHQTVEPFHPKHR